MIRLTTSFFITTCVTSCEPENVGPDIFTTMQEKAKTNKRKKEPLTVTSLREYPGLENLSDEEAAQAIEALEFLSLILFRYFENRDINSHESN